MAGIRTCDRESQVQRPNHYANRVQNSSDNLLFTRQSSQLRSEQNDIIPSGHRIAWAEHRICHNGDTAESDATVADADKQQWNSAR